MAPICTYREADACASLHYLGRGRYNRTGGATWHSPVLPPSVDFLDAIPCEPADELGRSHAKLPVTHTTVLGEKSPWRRRNGHWFFYARGCSDFAWDVGRTLLVQNRCNSAGPRTLVYCTTMHTLTVDQTSASAATKDDLAIRIEQKLRGGNGDDRKVKDVEGVPRVAAHPQPNQLDRRLDDESQSEEDL